MNYVKHQFKSGDVLLASQLNTMNDQIFQNAKALDSIESKNYWKGKKYCALGDSITYGLIPANSLNANGQLKSYAKLTAEKLQMSFVNYGISGSTVTNSIKNPMCRRFTDMANDADLITVMGGTNDVRNGLTLGTMSDRTENTFYGALHILLGGLYKKYMIDQGTAIGKNKTIVVMTPIKNLLSSASSRGGTGTLRNMDDWVEAIKKVSDYYSLPCLDMYSMSGINPHLNQTIQGVETGFTGFYNPYITDGIHPTQEGAEMMANILVGFLQTLR